MNWHPQLPKATRAARNGELPPLPPNVHTLSHMRVSPEVALALHYGTYPHAVRPNSAVGSGEVNTARMMAAAAHQTLTRGPERHTHEQPRQEPRPDGAEVRRIMKIHFEAEAADRRARAAALAAAGAGGGAGGAAAAANNNNNTNRKTYPTFTLPAPGGHDPAGFVDLQDIYDAAFNPPAADTADTADAAGNDQPAGGDASPSPIELNINTGVTVSQSDNMVVLAASPADVAGGVAAAVLAAIEQASSARVGVPMVDESGVPRPLRVRVDASIHIGGSGNVLGPEALIRECMLARAANGAGPEPREPAAAPAAENVKRGSEGAEDWDEDDAESVGSKKPLSA
ncbi:hypothetical protein RB595_000497 [Gaeumannomyces hyphopodioides]